MSASDHGPTIVLIGGRMTVDDGASFDSRQQMEGDENSEVTSRSLATSLLWWRTTISLVMPILQPAGDSAFALRRRRRRHRERRQRAVSCPNWTALNSRATPDRLMKADE
jgi:hypothetical protein